MITSEKNPDKICTIGIIGGGQLARMLSHTALRLGLRTILLRSNSNMINEDFIPAETFFNDVSDSDIDNFINQCDAVVNISEFTDIGLLERINRSVPVCPSPSALALIQDKIMQKELFASHKLPVPSFKEVNSYDDFLEFARINGYPLVLKLRKYSQNGYGNAIIFKEQETLSAWERLNSFCTDSKLMAESMVDISKELAVIVVRNASGETEVYPCVETVQFRHICHSVIAPAEISAEIRKSAQEIALACIEALDAAGVFGVELFLTKDEKLLVNEITPRLHNSGHYSIEACYTSQFENCIRAVCNLPLGSSAMIVPAAATVNLLGKRSGSGIPSNTIDLFRHKKVWLHFYNKSESRIGRKMGHITAIGNTQPEALSRAQSAADAIIW